MKLKSSSRRKRNNTKSILRLPDLEHAKAAVLNSLNSADAKRGYRHAIDEFVDWYCSEPRLAFNRIVVLRYRSHLESRQLAPGTINLRLGVVRRLAYEAADCGLLSADLAAGIRRVKGVKKLGIRLGNWLTAEQGNALWQTYAAFCRMSAIRQSVVAKSPYFRQRFSLQSQYAVMAPLVAQIYAHRQTIEIGAKLTARMLFSGASCCHLFPIQLFLQLSHQFRQHFFRIPLHRAPRLRTLRRQFTCYALQCRSP
jgi:hypothetical protein